MISEGDKLAGRYTVVGRVGRGGMAEVWEAQDDLLHRHVAVKVFFIDSDAGSPDSVGAERAVAEMRMLASLDHPNLVTVHDAGTDAGRTFLVMELVTGPTLADRLAEAPLDLAEVAGVGRQLAAALAYIHRRGIVHRDVKPANVLLPLGDHDDAAAAKLADFGIAQRAGQERLTQTGMTVGTARYLAPEQVTGKPVGPAADVYALGIVLLEMLGRGPEWTGTPIEVALARLTTPPLVPEDLGPAWVALLGAMTATDPTVRPSAVQIYETIATNGSIAPPASSQTSPSASPATTAVLPAAPRPTARSHWWPGVALAALLAGSVVTIVAVLGSAGGRGPVGGTVPTTSTPATNSVSSTHAVPSAVVVTPSRAAVTTSAPSASSTPPSPADSPGPGGRPGHTPPGQTKSKGKPAK